MIEERAVARTSSDLTIADTDIGGLQLCLKFFVPPSTCAIGEACPSFTPSLMEHMTMAARLTHIALHVDAIDEGVEFYQRYCGLKVIDDQVRGGRRMVLLSEPGREAHLVLQLIAGGLA